MYFLNYFYNKNLKFDLINKFFYTDLKKLPKLKKIIVNFQCETTELKNIASSLLALELITKQKGILTKAKQPNLFLKIRKGNPKGCKLFIKKTSMLKFFTKNIIEIFPKIKDFQGITINKKIETNLFSYTIKNTLNFLELTEQYYLFNNLPKLNITIITNTKTKKELVFFLKSLQLPLHLSK